MNTRGFIFGFFKRFSRKRYWFFLVLFFIPVWFFIIAPFLLRIPDDFHYHADIISVDNFYDETLGDYRGEQYSNTVFSYDIVDKKGPVLTIRNTFHVTAPDGRTIFKTAPLYGINRFTAMHVEEAGDRNRSGFLFAPHNVDKGETFEYWHVSSNRSVTMKYSGERLLYGLPVLKYESEYEGPFDQTEFMHHLPGVPEERGIKLGSIINMWVEPLSGYVVKIEDRSEEYYYFDIKTGQKIAPYNQFLNTYTEQSVRDHVKNALEARNKVILIEIVVPAILCFFLVFSVIFYKFPDFFLFSPRYFFPGFVFIFGISITVFLFFFSQNNIRKNEYEIFSQQAVEIKNLIEEKMEIYVNLLSGAKGFFDASLSVERGEWRYYVDALGIEKNYPGIQGLGFSRVLLPQEKNAFEDAVRREGFSDFKITPEGVRDVYTSIVFLEPFDDRNKRAFGYDMFSENVRRKAMMRARDTGLPALSGKVTLKQETDVDMQNGFLLYVPVYKDIQKEKNIFGYVYAPFRMKNFITSVIDSSRYDISFQVFDGLRIHDEQKLYVSDSFPTENDELVFRDLKTLSIAGHPWTIEFVNSPKFQRNLIYIRLSYGILALGFLISFLSSYTFYVLIMSRQKAIDYAKKVNKKLIKNVQELELTRDQTLRALDDVQTQKDKFHKANTRLKLATRSAHIGVWEWDIVHDKLIWDAQMYALYGYKKDEFVGKPYDAWYVSIHPEDKEKVDIQLKKSLKTKEIFDMKFRIIWPDTTIHDIRAFGLVETDEKGVPVHMVGVNWDITQEALIDRQKTEFVSIASHQLRTPLTAVSWYTEMMLGKNADKLSSSQKKYLGEIYQSNQVMIELVNKLLNVSRIELGTLKVESKETDISRIALDVLGEQQKNIKSKKLVIKKQFDHIDLQMSDPTLVRIIFQNLLANAIKYTPEGGEICLSLRKKEKSLLIHISDTGRGIPLSDQKDIFHKFFRAENTRDVKGTGLGLYIVKSMVEKLQGSISFESVCSDDKKRRRNSGTTFSVVLPLHSKKSS